MKSITARLSALGFAAVLAGAGGYIALHEGEVLGSYIDPAGILTACYGSTGSHVQHGQTFTQDECLYMLADDLHEHNQQLMAAVKVPLSEGEHVAYLSFHYNVGTGSFRSSTLLKLLNDGNRVSACHQLHRWVYANGKKLRGLVNRRADEFQMCIRDLQV
ncbi:lysozyme [Alishewanella sp. SMS8]|uniref:lysozyme n=1 Tax=Alishewanella sp. SMS8 TaxID=2994676 RepID=UPI002741CB76|nr:lysozyme [Alishewanella sp. SMS8]MDP5205806.1 lysozyme [Alishewanella sp. SMS9]MDP5459876.1 lysozyme [Alishewanella sp. SMS8]